MTVIGTHVFEAKEDEPDLCKICGNQFHSGGHISNKEARRLEEDFKNPSLHTFEISSSKVVGIGCARCGQSAIFHVAIPETAIDLVNHPPHYTSFPDGIECIHVTRWFNFNLGNAIKYIWRAGKKTTDPVQDLQKAMKYLEFEIERIKQYGNQS